MEANARNLERIFDSTVSYQIPLFQRPYVWKEESNWLPLWEDILSLLERQLNEGRCRTHFLGAVVLEQLNNASGSIETRQVIDGQQRFTTLQLFMIAVRDLCRPAENDKYFERFNDLVTNKANKVDLALEVYKVWPTNSDREAFELVHRSGSDETIKAALQADPQLSSQSHQIIGGYQYFYGVLRNWLAGDLDNEDYSNKDISVDDRLDALWQVVRNALQLVVIDLDRDDESQVIFETLNARGTQLLSADLVKNYLFRRAQGEGQEIEPLYEDYWKAFDAKFWRKEIKQGRLKRPRIDLFMQHYLTLMMREEIRPTHLFESFKHYVQDLELDAPEAPLGYGEDSVEPLTIHPCDTRGHLESLDRYARAFKSFVQPDVGSRLAHFLHRLEAVDTATVYPLLLLAGNKLLPTQHEEFDKLLYVLESFLMRRMICCLTTKNYNRLFLDAIKFMGRSGVVSAAVLAEFLKNSRGGDSVRFPDNDELSHAIKINPLYKRLRQYKLRAVLEALDMAMHDKKSEQLPLPDGLTIEHIMPRIWLENWSIPELDAEHPERKVAFVQNRNHALHTLGNLTLITGSLNPALSNGTWHQKRPELVKYSKLNLNRYFHRPSDPEATDELAEWNEEAIAKRAEHLSELAIRVWPY
ncbi:hypothetical protein A8C75_08965 [Marinobacterium aestuarii]|uniref:DUF262 domain-containing protein n=1 Tax=Marinobacterium aestuarii TaxID=1821621 RepID=A0A1A9EXY5_9GAMM|nr:DUF262 domain-containing protein [Marinobacterium aestuarii]ANG62600.1 hypothetical protein A8C75_08965 [Marinobacterium aestuarii]